MVQKGNGIGSFSGGSSDLSNPSCIQVKCCRKTGLKTGFNIITDILYKEPDQHVGNIFQTRFSQAKGNLEEKIKNMTCSGLALKRNRKTKRSQSQGKSRKVKDIFTEEKKKNK